MGDMRIQSAAAAIPSQNLTREQPSAPAASEEQAPSLQPPAPQTEDKTIWEMMKEAQAKAEERKKSLQLPKSTRYGDAPMMAYARLARARTPADVNAAAGYARRCIGQFKAALRQDSENADRIKAAINQLQKAVSRAGKKKRDLEQEKLADLRRRKSMRLIRERGYLKEAEIDNRLQSQLAETRMELRAQAQALSSTFQTSV